MILPFHARPSDGTGQRHIRRRHAGTFVATDRDVIEIAVGYGHGRERTRGMSRRHRQVVAAIRPFPPNRAF